MTRMIAGIMCLALVGCLADLNPMHTAWEQTAKMAIEHVRDQGVIDDFATNIDGHVQDPGVEAYTQITLAQGIRAKGVNGNVDLRTGGKGTHLPTGVKESLIRQLDGPISDEQRAGILQILGWNREATPHNPAGTGG